MTEGTLTVGAASSPTAALEPPLGVVAAAAGSTPGEDGEGRLAASWRFEAQGPEAGESRNWEAGLRAGIIRSWRVGPRPLHRLSGRRQLHRGRSGHMAEIGVQQGEGHPCVVGVGAVNSSP
jgi:hypothetical protein